MQVGEVGITVGGLQNGKEISFKLGRGNRRETIENTLAGHSDFKAMVDVALSGSDDYPTKLTYVLQNGREAAVSDDFRIDIAGAIARRPSLDTDAISRDLAKACADKLMAVIINTKP